MELRADGVAVGVSAEQVSVASYVVERRGSESFLVQRDVKINDRPNCQGLSPEFVRTNYLMEARIEVVGDRMTIYPSPDHPDIYLTFRRKEK